MSESATGADVIAGSMGHHRAGAARLNASLEVQKVLETDVNVVDWSDALDLIFEWAGQRLSRGVAACNAHSLVTAVGSQEFRQVLNGMHLVTPDGMSVVWLMRLLGRGGQQRVNGPDLMFKICERAALEGLGVFLYGNTDSTLARLQAKLLAVFPTLRIVGAVAPPFRALTQEEDRQVVEQINNSGASIVFVSLGCPKQEAWTFSHLGRVRGVILGVGAAFDFLAGVRPRAPLWLQRCGLEWSYRMIREPLRLGPRYVVTNSLFLIYAVRQLARSRGWGSR